MSEHVTTVRFRVPTRTHYLIAVKTQTSREAPAVLLMGEEAYGFNQAEWDAFVQAVTNLDDVLKRARA